MKRERRKHPVNFIHLSGRHTSAVQVFLRMNAHATHSKKRSTASVWTSSFAHVAKMPHKNAWPKRKVRMWTPTDRPVSFSVFFFIRNTMTYIGAVMREWVVHQFLNCKDDNFILTCCIKKAVWSVLGAISNWIHFHLRWPIGSFGLSFVSVLLLRTIESWAPNLRQLKKIFLHNHVCISLENICN